MSDPQASPISQLLFSLGLTREELLKRSDQMRQFLTSDSTPSHRTADREGFRKTPTFLDSQGNPTSSSSKDGHSKSLPHTRTNSLRDITPPGHPIVKTEQSDTILSSRPYTTMDIVIERQRRQNRKDKRARREKEREPSRPSILQQPSSSPKASIPLFVSLDSFMQSRDDQRAESADGDESTESDDLLPVVQALPVTPKRSNNYYREHTRDSTARKRATVVGDESPTPTRPRTQAQARIEASSQPAPLFPPYAIYSHHFPGFSLPSASDSLPVTPKRPAASTPKDMTRTPLTPSSPMAIRSSPVSSPAPDRVVNLVSSPGPMGPEPDEEEYDELPFALPSGPYSSSKPEQSYAAIIGQAVLSSPEHRLTLQEIYDWITIVYPYFKRGETTWMNSIRHVLSTTVCFRKVTRDRALGRTQWAIWEEDLECFKGGGFRKQFCKDYMNANLAKEKQGSGRGKGRKREAGDDTGEGRKSKRSKKEGSFANSSAYPIPSLSSHPLFPPTRPSAHHQPYYESCVPSQAVPLPAELIFPPLPAAAAFNRVLNGEIAPVVKTETPTSSQEQEETTIPPLDLHAPPASEEPSNTFVPELTPSNSSSPSESTSPNVTVKGAEMLSTAPNSPVEEQPRSKKKDEDDGINPADLMMPMPPFEEELAKMDTSAKGRKKDKGKTKITLFPLVQPSPTLGKTANKKSLKGPQRINAGSRHTTPPSASLPSSSIIAPSTPPRKRKVSQQYKYSPRGDSTEENAEQHLGGPTTPKKMMFPVVESPFRTPLGVLDGSPFRTPGSRLIFDPHDPRTMLDDELNRINTAATESPTGGLYGKGVGSLLYDSPGVDSPSKWTRWW